MSFLQNESQIYTVVAYGGIVEASSSETRSIFSLLDMAPRSIEMSLFSVGLHWLNRDDNKQQPSRNDFGEK